MHKVKARGRMRWTRRRTKKRHKNKNNKNMSIKLSICFFSSSSFLHRCSGYQHNISLWVMVMVVYVCECLYMCVDISLSSHLCVNWQRFKKHLWRSRVERRNLTPIYISMSLHEFILTVCACSCVFAVRSMFFFFFFFSKIFSSFIAVYTICVCVWCCHPCSLCHETLPKLSGNHLNL